PRRSRAFWARYIWGVAASDPERRHARLCWRAMPSLLAWILLFFPAYDVVEELALLFAAILAVDRYLLPLPDT
ncbi:MAG: hypothetical protein WBM71_18770, partial [Sedimenticolaceae bacterium]